ncbi:hypothetical protein Tco_0090117 [Tanacetum coccineum]
MLTSRTQVVLEMIYMQQLKVMALLNVMFDEKRGTIFNSDKEVVMIAQRVRDVCVLDMTSSAQESCFLCQGKFDEKADDGYLLGYSLVSKDFRVFNTRRQQTEETYHITFCESPNTIKFTKPLVDNINIAESKRYPPDEYLYPYETSQRWSQDKHIELVNIIGDPGAEMLIRAMAKELSAASAHHECLFIDFLSEK